MTSSSTRSIALPGQLLAPASKYQPGPGTHLHEANLYSSLLGVVHIAAAPRAPGPAKRLTKITPAAPQGPLPTISVAPAASPLSLSAAAGEEKRREVLPEVGNTVLCRVARITPRQAVVAILVVGETVLEAEWQGVIRVQDVRATEKDRVKIYESFRPGDIVRAQVVSLSLLRVPAAGRRFYADWMTPCVVQISLGDQANYYLSTASNELGVIMATSEAGNAMYPVSWREYKDPETGLSESRKVAKPY